MLSDELAVPHRPLAMEYLHDRKVLLDGPIGDHIRFVSKHSVGIGTRADPAPVRARA